MTCNSTGGWRGLLIPAQLFMPVLAWLVGVGTGLDGQVLLGVVITAALPSAQNIFLRATRYRVCEDAARETIPVTTLCCQPARRPAARLTPEETRWPFRLTCSTRSVASSASVAS